MLKDIEAAFDAVDLSEIRAIILTGAGEKSFVAGADIAAMSVMTKEQGEHFGKFGNDIFRKIETFPVPVIAAVNGFALGGGNELAMSCDIRICSDNALFGQPEVVNGERMIQWGSLVLFSAAFIALRKWKLNPILVMWVCGGVSLAVKLIER